MYIYIYYICMYICMYVYSMYSIQFLVAYLVHPLSKGLTFTAVGILLDYEGVRRNSFKELRWSG